MLHALIRWLQIKSAIEIGTHIGMTACWMGQAMKENGDGHLYCIDPFCWTNENQEEQWNTNIDKCGVRDYVTLIKGRSQEVEWPKAELVFVDGNHTYPVAKYDAEKARDRGAICIVLHDTVAWEGSRKHADEIRTDPSWSEWDKMEANFDCGLMVLLKRESKGPSDGEDIGEKWDLPK
jgi:predicted O-methyltransferase YrrM